MSAASVCPRELPIDIQIEISNNQITGYIFNQGNPENSHAFCKLYLWVLREKLMMMEIY